MRLWWDEIVVAHGDSTDTTRASLEALRAELPCELRIVDSPWDASNTRAGSELARQTNIALDHCRHDVCVYLQGDEVLLDSEYPVWRTDLERFEKDSAVEALVFPWIHFYGNFRTIVESRHWYRREARVVKKSSGLRSYGDAQGFRFPPAWTKPNAALSAAHVLHYGWVRPPDLMAKKGRALDRLWHGDARDSVHDPATVYPAQFGMKPYTGAHPRVMTERVAALGDLDPFRGVTLERNRRYWRALANFCVEALTGWRPGEFRNYRILKKY